MSCPSASLRDSLSLDGNVMPVSLLLCTAGHEGRIGMAAITLREGKEFDCEQTCRHMANYLPVYARPRFVRIQVSKTTVTERPSSTHTSVL